MTESSPRNYGDMTMSELIETIIRDSMLQGTINYPLRTQGYHASGNLVYTDRLSFGKTAQ